MYNKFYSFCLAVALMLTAFNGFAQRGKSEFTLGYGRFSSFQFANRPPYNTSNGTFSLAYRYYVSKDVTVGLTFANERISNWAGFATFAPEVTVKYVDTKESYRRVRLYGSISYGITAVTDRTVAPGQLDESGAKPWGFHCSPIGIRMGRQFAWFMEVGYGYKGLFHGGVAWRFPKHWRHAEVDGTEGQ